MFKGLNILVSLNMPFSFPTFIELLLCASHCFEHCPYINSHTNLAAWVGIDRLQLTKNSVQVTQGGSLPLER